MNSHQLLKIFCVTIFLLAQCIAAKFSGIKSPRRWLSSESVELDENLFTSRAFSSIVGLRGGDVNIAEMNNQQQQQVDTTPITVTVSTMIGSSFLDKKKKIIIPRNSTVADLKQHISQKFPGSPPVEMQYLYFGAQYLHNNDTLATLTKLTNIPILLDMISGTSVYNRNMSVSQALEAYVSTLVQQAYLGDQLNAAYRDNNESHEEENTTVARPMRSPFYRRMFQELNASLYEKYADDIAGALEREKNPETITGDTAAWRNPQNNKKHSPLTAALAKEFDLNGRGLRNFAYYSIILLVSNE